MLSAMLSLLLLFTCFFQMPDTTPRQLVYDVYSDEKHIGEIRATLHTDGEVRQYEMQTNVDYRILFKTMRFDNHITSQYRGDILTEASSTDHLNEKLRSKNHVRRDATGYCVREDDDEETSRIAATQIQHCLASIYFDEPEGLEQVFSQRLASLIPIREVAPHKYAVDISSSKTNYYHFENGICTKVEVNHWFDDFSFRLRKD